MATDQPERGEQTGQPALPATADDVAAFMDNLIFHDPPYPVWEAEILVSLPPPGTSIRMPRVDDDR